MWRAETKVIDTSYLGLSCCVRGGKENQNRGDRWASAYLDGPTKCPRRKLSAVAFERIAFRVSCTVLLISLPSDPEQVNCRRDIAVTSGVKHPLATNNVTASDLWYKMCFRLHTCINMNNSQHIESREISILGSLCIWND